MSISETSFRHTPRGRGERGMAVLLAAVLLLLIIPIMGLAIDAGLLYLVRGRLTAACDAASLATARNLNLGLTLDAQSTAASSRGREFFRANFPEGYLGTSNTSPSISVAQNDLSGITVTTSATTSVPLLFTRILGWNRSTVGAVGIASRRDVNLMLVLDRSGSMAGTPCTDMRSAAKKFVNMFVNGRDRLGLVTFNSSSHLAFPPSKYFKETSSPLTSKIDEIVCTAGTNSSDAYWTAYQQLTAINEPLALNMIVFFTDGVPTAFTARFPVKTVSDTRYGASGLSCGTSSQCSVPKSTCVDDSGRSSTQTGWGAFAGKVGTIVATTPESNATGNTLGLFRRYHDNSTAGDTMVLSSERNGCAMGNSNVRMRQDLAYIPDTDINGLSTSGLYGITQFPSSHSAYPNRKRLDMPVNLARVAANLADNAAASARNNTSINPVTYSIGLGNVDAVLLRRMANDVEATSYDDSRPAGLYIYSPTSSDLSTAFARIASEVLRLAQ